MTKDEAVAKFDSKWWEGKSAKEIVAFQLFEERPCTPFDIFHEAVEKCLGRPVFTHEFGMNYEGLCREFEAKEPQTA